MTKSTVQDKIDAIGIVQSMIEHYRFPSAQTDAPSSVLDEIDRIWIRLQKRKAALLTPKPRKPKAQTVDLADVDLGTGNDTGITIAGKTAAAHERRGRKG